MGSYSIRQLATLTGVKAHTLRVWEQRYQVIEPHRTDTNIRYYDEDHLKKLLNVSFLVNNGMRISDVCKLSEDEVRCRLEGIQCPELNVYTEHVNNLLLSMIDLDEKKFQKIFTACLRAHSFEDIVLHVFYPFLTKVGIMWGMDEINPAQEHFVTNLVRRKIIAATDNLKPVSSGETYVLFLRQGEFHEIGLLFLEYLLKSSGRRVIYLGQNVPWEDLDAVCKHVKPDWLYTFFISNQCGLNLSDCLEKLSQLQSKHGVLISGRPDLIESVTIPKRVKWLRSAKEALEFIG